MCVHPERTYYLPLTATVMSILSSMNYLVSNNTTYLWVAMGFMPFGLLFDLFDGKVARWRGKSSLMGQELDSLADLVSQTTAPIIASINAFKGLLRCRARCPGICNGLSQPSRSAHTDLLRPMRIDTTSTLQCHSRNAAEGRIRKIKILRGNAHSLRVLDGAYDGSYYDEWRMDT